MTFKFLQIELNTPFEVYRNKIAKQDSDNGVALYDLTQLEKKKLFGYPLKSVKLYFHERLISVSYQFEMSMDEYPDLMDCISLATASGPRVISKGGNSYIQWKGSLETLYCIADHAQQTIQLYHTLNKFDIIE